MQIKSGLEIHQQLDTHKLFCNCPSILRSDEPEFEVCRRLHAVAGETGEVDVAVEYEVGKDKEFVYQGYDTTCLVELDEEPPHLINQEALQIGLHISMLLNCEIVPIAQIMRKTVVDGSNTGGFQRTVLIARNGWVETEKGRVGISSVLLEEDAARIIKQEDGKKVKEESGEKINKGDEEKIKDESGRKIFRLDRLGIPLVEIATEPDIKSAEQAKEVALHIGDILRSCKVKRGIGTIRQDVNISIPGHPRIEIKGFQDPKMMIKTVEEEVKRQEENLKSKSEGKLKSEVRNALIDGKTEFLRPMPGSARMYPETDLPLLRISRDIINNAKESLPKLRTEVRKELREKGLNEEQIQILLKTGKLEEFESLLKIINDSKFIFKVLIEIPKEVGRHEGKSFSEVEEVLTLDVIESIVNLVDKEEVSREDVKHVVEEIVKGKSFDEAVKIEKVDLSEVENEIAKIIKKKPGLSLGGYMGLIMQKFKGKISGKEVNEILKKLL